MMKKILPDVIAIASFVLLSFVYFFPADVEQRILFQHDASAGTGAGQEAKQYRETTGRTTRWTNSIFGGMPTYQIAPSYGSTRPLTWIQRAYRLFLPEYVYLTFILMLGFYILLRVFGLPAWYAGIGGVLWAFSSYFFILIAAGHIWKFITLAYIPPTIAGVVLIYRKKLWWGALITALFTALQIASNHIQMSYYFSFVILLLIAAFMAEAVKHKQIREFVYASGVLMLAVLMGVAVNLSTLYHTYTYSKETMRGKTELVEDRYAHKDNRTNGLDRDYITQWSYGIDETLTLLVPNYKGGASVPLMASRTAMEKAEPTYTPLYQSLTQYFGTQPMTAGPVYVGAFVLALFVIGCFILKGPMKWMLLTATLFSIFLAWGKNFMPLTNFFIDFVPLYNKFRAVSSILVVAEFTIPLLAIFTLKRLVEEPELLWKRSVLWSGIAVTSLTLLLALLPGLLGNSYLPPQEAEMLNHASQQGMIPAEMLDGIRQNLSEMRAALVSADAWRSFLVVAVGMALLLLRAKGHLKPRVTLAAIALLCLVDMWGVNKRYLYDEQFMPASVRTDTFRKTAADEEILRDTTPDFRVLNLTGSTFNENNTAYWHKSVGGYHAAKLRRYQELIDTYLYTQSERVRNEYMQHHGDLSTVKKTSFPIVNMLNTRYFILPGEKGEPVAVYNPEACGNAWFVDEVKYAIDASAELSLMEFFIPQYTAIVDGRFMKTLHNVTRPHVEEEAVVTLQKYEPDHLVYQSHNPHEGVAVFSEIYYPDGWEVTVDGKKVEMARANYVLRALYLPAGDHTIEMRFDPKSLRVTELIANAAMILLVAGFVIGSLMCYQNAREKKKYSVK